MNKTLRTPALVFMTASFFFTLFTLQGTAQGVTTANIMGTVTDEWENPLAGAVVIAEHTPSGTPYATLTIRNGSFYLPDVRVGGPYRIKVTFSGMNEVAQDSINLSLGEQFVVRLTMKSPGFQLNEVVVTASAELHPGTSTLVDRQTIESIPTVNRSLEDLIKLSPQANGLGFAGKSPRLNYFTLDGSIFNNGYGLANSVLAGTSTGSQPISLDALEQVQINLAPYDIRQSGFTAAGINMITKKGDNHWKGSVYHYLQNASLVGQHVQQTPSATKSFHQKLFGFYIRGPLVKNKLFFFFNYEAVGKTESATLFQAARPTAQGNHTTRVLATDLENLSYFLRQQYGYETGAFEDYNLHTRNGKLTLNIDYNLSNKHKLGVRYVHLNAEQDKLVSNDNFVGAGNRNQNLFSLNYQNSNWNRFTKIRSLVAELTSTLRGNLSNRLLAGYSYFPDERKPIGQISPLVDILKEGRTYLTFGSDPYTYGNVLKSKVWQVQNYLNWHTQRHQYTFGFNVEYLHFENTFIPGYLGSFTYASLADFYQSTPAGTATPLGNSTGKGRPLVYQRNYSLLPASQPPTIEPSFVQVGIYAQDEYNPSDRFRLTAGLRVECASFKGTSLANPAVAQMTFRTRDGEPMTLQTGILPKGQRLWSPRVGFQWQLNESRSAQLRGGTGVFSGHIPFVLIGEQFRQNGLLSSTIKTRETEPYAFHLDPNAYPVNSNLTSQGYDIAVVDPNFKLPQIWRSSLGLDYQLNSGWVIGADILYSRDIHSFSVYNANYDLQGASKATDGRFCLLNSMLNAPHVRNAYVIDNGNRGRQVSMTAQLSKKWHQLARFSLSYTYGNAKELSSFPGTEPASALSNAATHGNPNRPDFAFSDFDHPLRLVAFSGFSFQAASWARTSCSILLEANQRGRFSYTYAGNGDLNGDGIGSNDLVFVPANRDQINLEAYTNEAGNVVTTEQQWQALNTFIAHSPYLSSRRGSFAERNGAILPWALQANLKCMQEFTFPVHATFHTLAFSVDLINLTNLLNRNWGLKQLPANAQFIEATSPDTFQVHPVSLQSEFIPDPGLASRWQIQFGVRYSW